MKKIGLLPVIIIAGSCLCVYLLVNSKKQSPIASILPEAASLYLEDNLANLIGKQNISKRIRKFGERADTVDNGSNLVLAHEGEHLLKLMIITHRRSLKREVIPEHPIQVYL